MKIQCSRHDDKGKVNYAFVKILYVGNTNSYCHLGIEGRNVDT